MRTYKLYVQEAHGLETDEERGVVEMVQGDGHRGRPAAATAPLKELNKLNQNIF